MWSLPKPEASWRPLTASELLAIRGTPEFEEEYRRQGRALSEARPGHAAKVADEFTNWDVSGWTYDED